jgi:hypothetical protein
MVIGLLAILTLILLLIMIGAIWGINVAMARMVGDKHHALEAITSTGQVPVPWRQRYDKKLARLRTDPNAGAQVRALEQRAAAEYLRRLDQLVTYVETTKLVDEEETRELMLKKLAAARSQWLADAGVSAAGTAQSSAPERS